MISPTSDCRTYFIIVDLLIPKPLSVMHHQSFLLQFLPYEVSKNRLLEMQHSVPLYQHFSSVGTLQIIYQSLNYHVPSVLPKHLVVVFWQVFQFHLSFTVLKWAFLLPTDRNEQ